MTAHDILQISYKNPSIQPIWPNSTFKVDKDYFIIDNTPSEMKELESLEIDIHDFTADAQDTLNVEVNNGYWIHFAINLVCYHLFAWTASKAAALEQMEKIKSQHLYQWINIINTYTGTIEHSESMEDNTTEYRFYDLF